ncbi:MAG: protein-glutamate O-methyltransferase CheR [Proteobacteria bacterium]|nr:protein-glutamate O-methyltransferase CheR [Pseudomonadota bacterium]
MVLNEPIGGLVIGDAEFETIRHLIYEQFGINLTEQKRSLVAGRLQKMIRGMGFTRFSEYLAHLETDASKQSLRDLINRISTNHTFFFRETAHFDYFCQTVLPELTGRLKQRNARDLRIWSAGCSSGEEAYTLVMLMKEFFGMDYGQWDAGLLATDISTDALATALNGIYPEERTSMIPSNFKSRYFKKISEDRWAVDPALKREIIFRRFNLMTKTFPFKQPFHVIFCRNVMIYFDQPTREALVQRFFEFTAPGGYLFIGHSESLRRDACPYDYVMPAVYRKRGE